MIKGVLLDVDGTLVLSNDLHAESWAEAYRYFGYDINFDQVRKLIGMGGDKLIPKLTPGLNNKSGQGKAISEYRSKIFLENYTPKLLPAPGSRLLIEKFISSGIKMTIASSAKEKLLNVLLKAAEVDDLIHEATTSDDVDKSKPDPDIIHAAINKIGLPPSQVLMIADTPYDTEAADKANVGLVAVRCGGWDDKNLSGAIAIYDDPSDIVTCFSSSPFSR